MEIFDRYDGETSNSEDYGIFQA